MHMNWTAAKQPKHHKKGLSSQSFSICFAFDVDAVLSSQHILFLFFCQSFLFSDFLPMLSNFFASFSFLPSPFSTSFLFKFSKTLSLVMTTVFAFKAGLRFVSAWPSYRG